MYIYIYINM